MGFEKNIERSKKMRPSVYLESKAENLTQALKYFTHDTYGKQVRQKLIVFMVQIDFWDWEMEELIFSFNNFEERSKVWDCNDLTELMNKSNFVLSKKFQEQLNWDLIYKKHSEFYRYGNNQDEVYAPYETLNETISTWNSLIDVCKNRIYDDDGRFGIQAPKIDDYKKKLIEIKD